MMAQRSSSSGRAMPTLEITLPALHPAQRQVRESRARFRLLAAGRRFGKTLLGCGECTEVGLQHGKAWWVAPSYKMAAVGWRGLKQIAHQIPNTEVREMDRMITYPGGGFAQVRSADDPQSLRGEGLDLVVFDEFAFTKREAWTEAVRPALSDRQGRALFISTPKGHNHFWEMWVTAQQDGIEWEAFQFPSSANPYLEPGEIEAARRSLPERVYAQEYLAEFIDDAGGVFRNVVECATATEITAPQWGRSYVFGVDWGKHEDFTVISVFDVGAKAMVALDRFNRIDYAVQTQRLKALFDLFQPRVIVAEQNSIGEPLIEQLQRDGLPVQPFTTTNASKARAVEALALAFERHEITIIPDPVLIAELQAFEMSRLPGGMIRYAAPDGMHDDCVMSVALAWQDIANTGSVFFL